MKKSESSKAQVMVLLSGGIDSAALLYFHRDRNTNVSCLFVDYGQAAARREQMAAQHIAEHYQSTFQKLLIQGAERKKSGLIMGRNGFLLMTALVEFGVESGAIAIGIHRGTEYADCSTSFVHIMQNIFDLYTNGTVQISAPFLKWTKPQVWQYAQKHYVPLKLTYSCENGDTQPCGKCRSCQDLEELNAN